METTKKPTPIAIIPISSIAVQFRDLVAEPDGAVTSDFTFESSLRLCPERYCLTDFFHSRWGQRDVEGATIVRALSNDPTGGVERFQSANQTCPLHDQHLRQLGNLEGPVLLQPPQDRELRNPTGPPAASGYRTDGSDGERSSGLRGRNRDRICLVSPPRRYKCAIAHLQEDLRCYNIVGPPLGSTLTSSTAVAASRPRPSPHAASAPKERWCLDPNKSYTLSSWPGSTRPSTDPGRRRASFRGYPAQGRAWTMKGTPGALSECV
jgi:hypothetical protein